MTVEVQPATETATHKRRRRERPTLAPQPKCPQPFVQFPSAILRDKRLKPGDLRVWGNMRSFSRRATGGVSDASQATIAEHCNMSVSSVYRSQRRLNKTGWLTLYAPGGRTGGWTSDTHVFIVNDRAGDVMLTRQIYGRVTVSRRRS